MGQIVAWHATILTLQPTTTFTYDHRTMNPELPVRSAVLKHCTGGLVVRWVTTSEYPLLYVFAVLFAHAYSAMRQLLTRRSMYDTPASAVAPSYFCERGRIMRINKLWAIYGKLVGACPICIKSAVNQNHASRRSERQSNDFHYCGASVTRPSTTVSAQWWC